MPLPMTPTVLTVLTNASASDASRFPVPGSIISTSSSVVPVFLNCDARNVRHAVQTLAHEVSASLRVNRDAPHAFPRDPAMSQKLRLLLSLRLVSRVVVRAPLSGVDRGPVQLAQISEIVVVVAEGNDRVTTGEDELLIFRQVLRPKHKVHDVLLTVGHTRHVAEVDCVQHWRSRCEVERHVIVKRSAWVARDCRPRPNGLDSRERNAVGICAPSGQGAIAQQAMLSDTGQVVHMAYVVDRCSHQHLLSRLGASLGAHTDRVRQAHYPQSARGPLAVADGVREHAQSVRSRTPGKPTQVCAPVSSDPGDAWLGDELSAWLTMSGPEVNPLPDVAVFR